LLIKPSGNVVRKKIAKEAKALNRTEIRSKKEGNKIASIGIETVLFINSELFDDLIFDNVTSKAASHALRDKRRRFPQRDKRVKEKALKY
jgi:hypothetical protein